MKLGDQYMIQYAVGVMTLCPYPNSKHTGYLVKMDVFNYDL